MNHVHLEADGLGQKFPRAPSVALRPSILNHDVATLGPAKFTQPLHKGRRILAKKRGRGSAEKADGRQLAWLLRAGRERPRHRRAAEKGDELAPSHRPLAFRL